MDERVKVCLGRVLDLQIRLAQIVSKLCEEASMDPDVRKRLVFDASLVSESLEKTRDIVTR